MTLGSLRSKMALYGAKIGLSAVFTFCSLVRSWFVLREVCYNNIVFMSGIDWVLCKKLNVNRTVQFTYVKPVNIALG